MRVKAGLQWKKQDKLKLHERYWNLRQNVQLVHPSKWNEAVVFCNYLANTKKNISQHSSDQNSFEDICNIISNYLLPQKVWYWKFSSTLLLLDLPRFRAAIWLKYVLRQMAKVDESERGLIKVLIKPLWLFSGFCWETAAEKST